MCTLGIPGSENCKLSQSPNILGPLWVKQIEETQEYSEKCRGGKRSDHVGPFKNFIFAMAGVVGASSHNQKVVGSIPNQGTCVGHGFFPSSRHAWHPVQVCVTSSAGAYRRQPIDISLSHPPSLKAIEKKCHWVRIKKTQKRTISFSEMESH